MKQYKTLDMNDGRGGEHIQTHARPLWIISTFLISYLLNLASSTANVLWLPDPLALTLIYWTIHHPRHVGMTIAFICGLLMDVQNGSVLGQQALAYVILSYSAYSLHRRLPWFGLAGQALHILPLLLVSQLVVLMIRLWFDGLWPGFPWFLQSFTAPFCGRPPPSSSPFRRGARSVASPFKGESARWRLTSSRWTRIWFPSEGVCSSSSFW